MSDIGGKPEVREVPLYGRTLIFDRERQEQIGWIDGVVVPPVGAEVELSALPDIRKNLSAFVTGVRIAFGPKDASVTLDVDVPEEWYREA